jgi:hypothetical protein
MLVGDLAKLQALPASPRAAEAIGDTIDQLVGGLCAVADVYLTDLCDAPEAEVSELSLRAPSVV